MRKLIIFDMDGVLVDVSRSYRDTVRAASLIFLRACRGGGALPDPLFELSDLAAVKQSGGLNNDWDLTSRVITLLLSKALNVSGHGNRSDWDVGPLAEYLRTTERPLEKLLHESTCAKCPEADFYYRGDVGSGNLIKQIFQEIYLGPELFRDTYGFSAEHYTGDGFILREKLFMGKEMLLKIEQGNYLAIATGRPAAEALYPVEKNRIGLFRKIVSLDDCLKAEDEEFRKSGKRISLSKPDPYMLDVIAGPFMKDIAGPVVLYYVGDMPDDMVAAKRSKYPFTALGVTYSSPSPESAGKRLAAAGADLIAATVEELADILLS